MARARACVFHKQSGVGAWGIVPLTAGDYGKSAENAEVGLRYSTPAFTAGAVVSPTTGVLNQLWVVCAIALANCDAAWFCGVALVPCAILHGTGT